MGFQDRFFGKKNEKPKTLKPAGDREGAYLAAEEKEHNEVSHQNTHTDDQGVRIIKVVFEAQVAEDPGKKEITLESMLNDELFSKENPQLYEQFLEELKRNEPALFKERFGEGNDDWKLLNNIYPIVKNRLELQSYIEWENGQIKLGSAMDGLIVVELFDNILLIFGLDNGGERYEWLKISHFSDFEKVGTNQVMAHAYLNYERMIKENLSIEIYPGGIGMLLNGGGKESSFIMHKRVWSQIQEALQSHEIVFAIPTQDIFIFCASASAQAIEKMKSLTYKSFTNPSLLGKISSNLFHRNGEGKITVFAVDYFPVPGE